MCLIVLRLVLFDQASLISLQMNGRDQHVRGFRRTPLEHPLKLCSGFPAVLLELASQGG